MKKKSNNKVVIKRISRIREMIVLIIGGICGILFFLYFLFGLGGLVWTIINPEIGPLFVNFFRNFEFYFVIIFFSIAPIGIFCCFYKPKNVTMLRYSDEYTEPIKLKLKQNLNIEEFLFNTETKEYKSEIFCCKYSIEELKRKIFKINIFIDVEEISKEFYKEYSKKELCSFLKKIEYYMKDWKHIDIVLITKVAKKNGYFDKITKYNMFTNKYISYLPVFINDEDIYISKFSDGFGLNPYTNLKIEFLKKIKPFCRAEKK